MHEHAFQSTPRQMDRQKNRDSDIEDKERDGDIEESERQTERERQTDRQTV